MPSGMPGRAGEVRSFAAAAVEVDEENLNYVYRESLNGVGADDCHLSFRGRVEGGGGTRGRPSQHPF